mmetsp:Transcript_27415/g.59907  ORF Transcript_27415/g.59907 Transcript_27415/m.59907 type:complete len:173 (-) Transcript_27415:270-788(-)
MASTIARTFCPVAVNSPAYAASKGTRSVRASIRVGAQQRVSLARVARRGGIESQRVSQRVRAEEGSSTTETATTTTEPEVEVQTEQQNGQNLAAQIFGSNLQVAVWVTTLTYAGYRGYQEMSVGNNDAGMLLAPPAAAAFLITVFLAWYSVSSKAAREKKEARRKEREAEGR